MYNVIMNKNDFKYRYTTSVKILLFAVLITASVGIVWNAYNVYSFFSRQETLNGAIFCLVFLLNLLLLIIDVSMLTCGKYVVRGRTIRCCFGIIISKYSVDDAMQFVLFKKTDKLVLYFKDATYTVIVISPEEYDAFISAVREINPSILYDNAAEE